MEDYKLLSKEKLLIGISLYLATNSFTCLACIQCGYIAVYLEDRAISKIWYAAIESSVGIGVALASIFKIFFWLYYDFGFKVRSLILGLTITAISASLLLSTTSFIENNHAFIAVVILLKTIIGMTGQTLNNVWIEGVRVWFPRHFQLMYSIICSGGLLGYGVGAFIGASLYDITDMYSSPCLAISLYLFISLTATFFVIPNISTAYEKLPGDESDLEGKEEHTSLSPYTFLPLFSVLATNLSRGVMVLTLTPYSVKVLEVSVWVSGFYFFLSNCTMTIICIIAGFFSQNDYVSFNTQSIVGSITTVLALLVVYPPSYFYPMLVTAFPYVVGFAIFCFSAGDNTLMMVCISQMEEVHETITASKLARKQKNLIDMFWFASYQFGIYGGRFMSGFFMVWLSWSEIGCLLSGLCGAGLVCLIIARFKMKRS